MMRNSASTSLASTAQKQAPNRWGYLILVFCVAAAVLVVFVLVSNVNQNESAHFADMVYGRAERPFVYRILVPVTIRLASGIIPSQVKSYLSDQLGDTPLFQSFLAQFDVPRLYLVEAMIGLASLFLSLLGFALALRYLTVAVFHAPSAFADLVPLLATLGLIPFFTHGYVYDLTVLFLFTLELALLAHFRWWLFLLIFPLVCLNKETAFLLTLVFAVYFWRDGRLSRGRYLEALVFQGVVFVTIKLGLTWIFRNNPGAAMAFHLSRHLRVYRQNPILTLAYGSFLALLTFLTFYRWSEKPKLLLSGTLMSIPLSFLYLLGGWPFELRVFYEVYPVVFLLCAHSVALGLGFPVEKSRDNALQSA